MPTNVTPEHKKAEAEFRAARTTEERRAALRKSVKTLPSPHEEEKSDTASNRGRADRPVGGVHWACPG
jgi:hypothetical protein